MEHSREILMATIMTCAQLSKAVYSMSVPDGLDIIGYERIICQETSTQGCAYITSDTLYVAMQGSAEGADWLNNFKIIRRDYHGITAHRGFALAAESVLEQVHRILDDWSPSRRVVMTGHSLGGAIAVLLAVACRPRPVEVVTFGQPRVSRRRQLDLSLYGPYLRVVNGSDIVPRKPWLGYSHGGNLLYLTNDGRRLDNPSWFARVKDRIWMTWQRQRITDHRMTDYIKELEQCDTR